jgi:hypothetical protein
MSISGPTISPSYFISGAIYPDVPLFSFITAISFPSNKSGLVISEIPKSTTFIIDFSPC